MDLYLIVFFTLATIAILTFFNISLQYNSNYSVNTLKSEESQTKSNLNPKKELVEYFAYHWSQLKPYLLSQDCSEIKIPIELEKDFKDHFGHYFINISEEDPLIETYAIRNYQMTFEMEFREICQTLTTLKKYLRENPEIKLKNLGTYLEWLHLQHFPQAVFISVILDEMVRTCQNYPRLNLLQIGQTDSLLTMKVIDSL